MNYNKVELPSTSEIKFMQEFCNKHADLLPDNFRLEDGSFDLNCLLGIITGHICAPGDIYKFDYPYVFLFDKDEDGYIDIEFNNIQEFEKLLGFQTKINNYLVKELESGNLENLMLIQDGKWINYRDKKLSGNHLYEFWQSLYAILGEASLISQDLLMRFPPSEIKDNASDFMIALSEFVNKDKITGEEWLLFLTTFPSLLIGFYQFRVALTHFEIQQNPVRRYGAKIGRNDPCPCGSGKKYKKCCGQ